MVLCKIPAAVTGSGHGYTAGPQSHKAASPLSGVNGQAGRQGAVPRHYLPGHGMNSWGLAHRAGTAGKGNNGMQARGTLPAMAAMAQVGASNWDCLHERPTTRS